MINSIKTSLPIALHARNSPRWVRSVIENVRRKGVGSVGLYPFIQALESVTEKRTAIPCENLVTDQIRKDCWIEKLSKFLGESVRSRNCNSFFCYGFSAKDTGYRPTDPTPLRLTFSITERTHLGEFLAWSAMRYDILILFIIILMEILVSYSVKLLPISFPFRHTQESSQMRKFRTWEWQARGWMRWLTFVGQALEAVTEKGTDILREDLASSQI